VTQHALQKRYPPARDRFSTHYSTIELSDNAFSEKGRYEKYSHARNSACLRIVTVGTLHALYKGPDILIEAIRKCIAKNFDLRATWVGDGRHRIGLIKMAKEAGLSEKVSFIGALPAGAAVREILDQADIYVLPSRQEGLPRSVLEAMARTLPVIATNVGGISELIDAEFIIPPGDSDALASKIMELSSDPWLLQSAATANELTAKDYHVSILQQRRYQFYEYLRAATASASL
jgi:glycosyltransferase involved in cell wall biosynthesis